MRSTHSTFKDEVEKHVKDFLELVKEMYGNLREVVREEFGIEGEVSDPYASSLFRLIRIGTRQSHAHTSHVLCSYPIHQRRTTRHGT